MVELTIPQPITSELNYSACGKIDMHNRCRQESLDIEKKLGTKDWLKRFNLSALEMNMVDLTIPNTITAEIYYSACGQIDRHNRCRQ